jgi:hypothetical protein
LSGGHAAPDTCPDKSICLVSKTQLRENGLLARTGTPENPYSGEAGFQRTGILENQMQASVRFRVCFLRIVAVLLLDAGNQELRIRIQIIS